MEKERTFVMIKPDAVQRGLIGKIISRIEQSGLKIVAMKFIFPTLEHEKKHYAVHEGKPFYDGLVKFITSGPAVPMVVEGENAIQKMRTILGATDPQSAAPGTIRGDFGLNIGRNLVHAADSLENAEYEMGVYFEKGELVDWKWIQETWVYEE